MGDTIVIETPVATVLEVSGKQGPQGVPGATGATGAVGPQGPAGTGIETLTTAGDLLYRDNSAAARLPIGSSSQILKVVNGLPAWANESGAVTSVNGQTGAVTIPTFSYGFGGAGLVPQATGGDAYKFLKGDGTWADTPDYVTPSEIETDWFDRGGDNAATRPGTGGQKRYQVVLSNDTRLTDQRSIAWTTPAPSSPTDNTTNPPLGSVAYDGNYLYILVLVPGGQSKRWGRVPMPLNW